MKMINVLIVFSVYAVALITAPAAAQQTTSESDLRAVIESLQSGSPDFSDMEPALRIAVREQKTQVDNFLNGMGPIQEITFEESDQGVDVYIVKFQNGRSVWQFARSPRGKIAVLYFNAL